MKTAVFVYEEAQVDALPGLITQLPRGEEYDIIACAADLEYLLKKSGVEFVSARNFRRIPTVERLVAARHFGEDMLLHPALSFFSHKGIPMGKLFLPSLQYYLMTFLYDLDIVAHALEHSYDKALTYGPSTKIGKLTRVYDSLTNQAYPDALKLVCEKRGIVLTVVPFPGAVLRSGTTLKERTFMLKRSLFGFMVGVLNWYVRLRAPKKSVRILASELWKNIEALMHKMPDAELVLIDRAESLAIGLKNILKHRMQFMHSNAFVTAAMKRRERELAASFKKEWAEKQKTHPVLETAVFAGYPLRSVLTNAVGYFIDESERVLREIDGTWRMIESLQPGVVMVRAGISAQTHFAVMCEAARLLNVPSLEVQHGILSAFEGDFTSNPSPEYIAEYGPIVREVLNEANFAPRSTFLDVGSPRFDVYAKRLGERKPMEDGVFKILHIGPQLTPGGWNDSYDVIDYFTTAADAIRDIRNAQVTVKIRGMQTGENFLRSAIKEAYRNVPHTITLSDPLSELLPQTDVVVTGHSTSFLEAMLAGKPVIIDTSLQIFAELTRVDLKRHIASGALKEAASTEALSEILKAYAASPQMYSETSAAELNFMRQNYLFNDGKSSERLAEALRALAKKAGQTR